MSRSEPSTPIAAGSGDVAAAKPTEKTAFEHDLTRFTLADMVRCGASLRLQAADSASMEEAAQKITRYLYENLGDNISNQQACVLVRFFKTHAYAELTRELREFADYQASPISLSADTTCLILLATSGDDPSWNSRHNSKAHKSIPLVSQAMVEQFPMISNLIREFGLSTTELLQTKAETIKELQRKKFGLFHVPAAANSPIITAQKDFVIPYGIASVLGFGGILPGGELFVVIIFSRVSIPSSTAEMFGTVALNIKLGLLALLEQPVFAE